MVKKRKRKPRGRQFDSVKDQLVCTCLFNLQKQFFDGGTPDEQVAYVLDDHPEDVAFMTVPVMMEAIDKNQDKVDEICKQYGIPDFGFNDEKVIRNSFLGNCRGKGWPHMLVSPTWMAAEEVHEAAFDHGGVEIGSVPEGDIAKLPNRVEIIICQLWMPGMGENYDERYAEVKRGLDGTEIGNLYTLKAFCEMLDKEGRFDEGK